MDRAQGDIGRLASLQVLRFTAALAVAWEHAHTVATNVYNGGGAFGVDVFFVLSGFVISRAAETKAQTFLRDRLTRVLPGYWMWCAAWLAVVAVGAPFDPVRLFATVTLIPSMRAPLVDPYVNVSWTLTYELIFYLSVWAVLRGARPRWLLTGYGALLLAGLVVKVPIIRFLGSPMVIEFLLGIIAYRIGRVSKLRGALALSGAFLIWLAAPKALGVAYASEDPLLGPVRATIWGPAAFLAVWGAAQFDCKWRGWRSLVLLGDASFSIYLGHILIYIIWLKIAGRFGDPVAMTALAVGIGLVVYLVAERPLTLFSRRCWALAAASASPAAPVTEST